MAETNLELGEFGFAGDDAVVPYAVAALDARGRAVQLGSMVDAILSRHDYPAPVAQLLAEMIVLTVLLGTSLKFDGKFIAQTQTDGPVDLLVVDFTMPSSVRAYARFDAERFEAAVAAGDTGPEALLGNGIMALTIDQGEHTQRYQGIVELSGASLEAVAETYFRQSEQIPTQVRLAVAEQYAGGARTYRAGGLLVQFLPQSIDRARLADLPPGDIPEGHVHLDANGVPEDDAWVEARSLVSTIEDHELVDPEVSAERLLYRLFHERGVRVFEAQGVREQCRCSPERVMAMIVSFSPQERRDMIADDGRIGITCEFCSRRYDLDPADVEAQAAAAG